jgi:hypothetical protein
MALREVPRSALMPLCQADDGGGLEGGIIARRSLSGSG